MRGAKESQENYERQHRSTDSRLYRYEIPDLRTRLPTPDAEEGQKLPA